MPHLSPDEHRDLIPAGRFWDRPWIERAALVVALRPPLFILGSLASLRQAIALRAPYWPISERSARAIVRRQPGTLRARVATFFAPMGWIHELPCAIDPEWPHRHDEIHEGPDDCGARGPHAISYERDPHIAYVVFDDFDIRVDRGYAVPRPPADPDDAHRESFEADRDATAARIEAYEAAHPRGAMADPAGDPPEEGEPGQDLKAAS